MAGDGYASRHDPFVYFKSITGNKSVLQYPRRGVRRHDQRGNQTANPVIQANPLTCSIVCANPGASRQGPRDQRQAFSQGCSED